MFLDPVYREPPRTARGMRLLLRKSNLLQSRNRKSPITIGHETFVFMAKR